MALIRAAMASTGPLVTTGEGHVALGAAEEVSFIRARLTVANFPQTAFIGTMFPRGVWQVGSAGLGSWPDDSIGANPATITWYRFLRHELEEWHIGTMVGGRFLAGSLWWRWEPATTVVLEAFW